MYYNNILGEDHLVYTNYVALELQRSILSDFLKKIGKDLISGNGTENVNLSVKLFDSRTLLEMFAHQHRQIDFFLNNAYKEKSPVNRIKWVYLFTFYLILIYC